MKYLFRGILFLVFFGGMFAEAAYADNQAVETALANRPDLSRFYQELMNTGVNHELNAGMDYTVFAPTNEAMARMERRYPCFTVPECRLQAGWIIRNHIVPGAVYIDDAERQRGGLYSISGRFITLGQPSRNDYAIEGHTILYMSDFGNGILYKINGLIVNSLELASLVDRDGINGRGEKKTTTVKKVIPDPACGPPGCPDAMTTTMTVSHSMTIGINESETIR